MNELTLEDMKSIELNMLEYINNICKENDIEYFLVGGSMLGAVRHKGFIPWDDDIDIGLKRKEYIKLINILKEKNDERYKVLDSIQENSYYYPYAKLIDTNTVWKSENCKEIKKYGVFIDIFAFDNLPDSKIKRQRVSKKKKFLKKLIGMWALEKVDDKNIGKRLIKKVLKWYAEKLGIKEILKRYDELSLKYNELNTKYGLINWPSYSLKNEIQETKLYDKLIDCQFENLNVKIPKDYDKILTQLYGDYMTPPPENKRVSSHDGIKYWKE